MIAMSMYEFSSIRSSLARNYNKKSTYVILVLLFLVVCFLYIQSQFSTYLYEERIVIIEHGSSATAIAKELHRNGVISSPHLFILFHRLDNGVLKSGTYEFIEGRHQLGYVLQRLKQADYGDVYTRITIPEGSTIEDIVDIILDNDFDIDREVFMSLSKGKEGYLFPDTYFFLPFDTEEDIVVRLTTAFDTEYMELSEKFKPTASQEDILIMASLIEKEATRDMQEMKIVSGILWKRLREGIPLQVDAPFLYVQGKTSAQLRISDLREDGPYNTYTRTGLPIAPIANPGSMALEAAMDPVDSPYYFYLHGNDGVIRYGVTHDDHITNKQRYLR